MNTDIAMILHLLQHQGLPTASSGPPADLPSGSTPSPPPYPITAQQEATFDPVTSHDSQSDQGAHRDTRWPTESSDQVRVQSQILGNS